MPARSLKVHAARLILAAAAVLLAGWVAGRPGEVFLAAVAVFCLWHVVNVALLHRWLAKPEGKAPGSVGVWADIYQRIGSMNRQTSRQSDRYRAAMGDFQAIFDAFPDATLVVDQNACVTGFNKAAGALLELSEGKDIGLPATSLLRNIEFANWLAMQDEVTSRLEMHAPGQSGKWLEVSSVPIRENQRLIILRDVTEVHNVDRIRRDFVTNVSHELRTPLTVMLGYLEIFQERPADDLTDALQRMHAQAVQMQFMLDDFLELSRLQTSEEREQDEQVEIAPILLQLREQAEEISRGDHEINFEVDPALNLCGIGSDLESAFRNLIVNALKYTPEGGSVSVLWHETPEGPTLTVSDTGIGIPQREIPRLTERFYRVGSDRGRKSGGTGLGLAIVKHVMNAHQARLTIDSEVGVGSRFSCIFPAQRKIA